MSRAFEKLIECPFYMGGGREYIICEGIVENTTTRHYFETYKKKSEYLMKICCNKCGKKCLHYRNVKMLYDIGERGDKD